MMTLVGSNIAVPVANKLGSRKTVFVCTLIYAISLIGASLQKSILPFTLLYSILLGTSVGVLYMLPVCVCVQYFP